MHTRNRGRLNLERAKSDQATYRASRSATALRSAVTVSLAALLTTVSQLSGVATTSASNQPQTHATANDHNSRPASAPDTPITPGPDVPQSHFLPRPTVLSRAPGPKPSMPPVEISGVRAHTGPASRGRQQSVASQGSTAKTSNGGFSAQGQTGPLPGEPSVAAKASSSSGYLLETVNRQFAVYGRAPGSTTSGYLYGPQTFSSFFGSNCDDANPIYWNWDDRWAFECRDLSGSQVKVAFSSSNDPTKGWYWYGFAASSGHQLDQPSITVSGDKILVVAELFDTSGNDQNESEFFVANKSEALQGQTVDLCEYTTPSDLFRAVVRYTNDNFDARAVGDDTTNNILYLANATGPPPSPTNQSCPVVNVYPVEGKNTASLRDAPIPGGGLHSGSQGTDNRILNAVEERDGQDNHDVIEFSSTENVGNQLGVETVRLDLSTFPTIGVAHTYDFWEGNDGFDYAMGGVTLDAFGDIFATFTRTSSAVMPQAVLEGFNPSGGVLFNQIIYGQTNTTCGSGSNCRERWGDYLGATQNGYAPNSYEVFVGSLYQAAAVNPAEDGWGTVIAAATQSAVE